jgi:hypothetical protein
MSAAPVGSLSMSELYHRFRQHQALSSIPLFSLGYSDPHRHRPAVALGPSAGAPPYPADAAGLGGGADQRPQCPGLGRVVNGCPDVVGGKGLTSARQTRQNGAGCVFPVWWCCGINSVERGL